MIPVKNKVYDDVWCDLGQGVIDQRSKYSKIVYDFAWSRLRASSIRDIFLIIPIPLKRSLLDNYGTD